MIDLKDFESVKTFVANTLSFATEGEIELLLTISAGLDSDGNTVYRPYWVMGHLLFIRPNQIIRAETVTFVNPLEVAKNYMRLQMQLDDGLTIPEGTDAILPTTAYSMPMVRV